MTKAEKQARKAIKEWCKANNINVISIRHVHPISYVLGRAASFCLIVARPWFDSEKQLRDFNKSNPLETVHKFDTSLKAGDWCATGYVVTDGTSETVAVRMDKYVR